MIEASIRSDRRLYAKTRKEGAESQCGRASGGVGPTTVESVWNSSTTFPQTLLMAPSPFVKPFVQNVQACGCPTKLLKYNGIAICNRTK